MIKIELSSAQKGGLLSLECGVARKSDLWQSDKCRMRRSCMKVEWRVYGTILLYSGRHHFVAGQMIHLSRRIRLQY